MSIKSNMDHQDKTSQRHLWLNRLRFDNEGPLHVPIRESSEISVKKKIVIENLRVGL